MVRHAPGDQRRGVLPPVLVLAGWDQVPLAADAQAGGSGILHPGGVVPIPVPHQNLGEDPAPVLLHLRREEPQPPFLPVGEQQLPPGAGQQAEPAGPVQIGVPPGTGVDKAAHRLPVAPALGHHIAAPHPLRVEGIGEDAIGGEVPLAELPQPHPTVGGGQRFVVQQIAAQAAEEKTDMVVAIGGDGTINEIARSLVHTDTALGIIPCGSGNGLARHLHIPMEPKRALEVLNEGCMDVIDYGKINGTDFFCTCGVGFDAFVSLKFAHAGKRGLLTYLEKTLQESLKYEPETYELETENGVSKYKAFLIACGNASQYGNNAYIAPQATLTDGLLDVTILEPFTVLDVPSLAFQLFNKTIDQNSRIKTFRCKQLCIRRTTPGVVHFDGDPMETDANVNIQLIQRGLRVVVPRASEKDAANVLQRAQEYMNGIKLMNEAIVDNITDRNKKILKKLTKKV